jgi:hypothetical protein
MPIVFHGRNNFNRIAFWFFRCRSRFGQLHAAAVVATLVESLECLVIFLTRVWASMQPAVLPKTGDGPDCMSAADDIWAEEA